MSTFDLLRFERLQQSLFPPSLKNTACVLWIGKNYRLQDIQLSKNPVNLSVDACGHPRQPQNSRVAPARFRAPRSRLTAPGLPSEARQDFRSPTFAKATMGILRVNRERRMVENTGLEPVTSWLQTRRSPS